MRTQDEINQEEWERPENWTGALCIYRSARDVRIWVPKRNPKLGQTLNFAHAGAWWTLLGLSIVPIALLILLPLLLLLAKWPVK